MSDHRTEHVEPGALSDEQLMLVMAYVDGELEADVEATREAAELIANTAQAQTIAHDLRLSAMALRHGVLEAQPTVDWTALEEQVLANVDNLHLMRYADNELADEGAVSLGVQSLLADSPQARSFVADLQRSRLALRQAVEHAPADQADFSMVRGRIMTALVAEPREAIDPSATTPWWQSLQTWLQPGRLAYGVATAALLVVMGIGLSRLQQQVDVQVDTTPTSPVAEQPRPVGDDDELPAVIIEEVEHDSGTVSFEAGENPGDPMIIWHPEEEEEIAG